MARKRIRSQTEWLVNVDEAGSEDVHDVVVYRLQTAMDTETGQITLRKLWVVARGYAGGGAYEDYSGVMYPEADGHRLVGCRYACPDPENFAELEVDYLEAKDYEVIVSLWKKADRLTTYELAETWKDITTFTVRVPVDEGSDRACSGEWDGNLLVTVSKQWPLFLYFNDERWPSEKQQQPLIPLCPRPAGLFEYE